MKHTMHFALQKAKPGNATNQMTTLPLTNESVGPLCGAYMNLVKLKSAQ